MNRKISVVLAFSLVFVYGSCLSADQPVKLTILHANDTHSRVFPFGPQDKLGGIARMSTLIKKLKAKNENVLTLHGGDVFVGSFAFNKYLGYPELKIMEGLYDAMAIGNHEFDLGLDALYGILSGAIPTGPAVELPVLCANIEFPDPPHPVAAFIQPHMIIDDLGGLKIGIFAVVNNSPFNYSPDVYALLTDPFAAAGLQVATLRSLGCQVVICISHLGFDIDSAYLAPNIPGIDIIVSAHSHTVLENPVIVNGEIIVQAGEFGMYLGELEVSYNGSGVSLEDYDLHPVTQKIRKDPSLLRTLNRLRVGLVRDRRFRTVMTSHVARADWDMEKTWPAGSNLRDSAVGNLVSDAILNAVQMKGYEVDFAIEAQGYIGDKIYKGKIVGDDVMHVVPYGYDPESGLGFKIVVVPLYGIQIGGGLEFTLANLEMAPELLLQPSGMTYEYNSSYPPMSRLTSLLVGADPIDPFSPYLVAMNEQVYGFLKSLDPVNIPDPIETGIFVYNAVRDYMKKLNHVRYYSEGRVIDQN